MSEGKQPMAFVAACKDFFGLKPDQNLRGFMDECKELTDKDRADIRAGLESNGYAIKD